MVARSNSGNNLHFAWARCRLTVPGWQPAAKSFLISSIWVCGWCFGGSCSSATSAVAKASVMTHPSWPVIPFFGISPSPRACQSSAYEHHSHRPSMKRRSRTSRAWSSRREFWSAKRLLRKRPPTEAALLAFVFRDVRQTLKLVCQNCPTLRNGHERGVAADRNINLLHEEPIFGCIGVALLGCWHDRSPPIGSRDGNRRPYSCDTLSGAGPRASVGFGGPSELRKSQSMLVRSIPENASPFHCRASLRTMRRRAGLAGFIGPLPAPCRPV